MISQPSLDLFSQPGSMEKYHGVKVLLLLPECYVCGQEVDPRFLKKWNGRKVCRKCIHDLEEEYIRDDQN